MSFTGRGTIGSPTVNATITASNKIALIVFDGVAGQQLSLGISAGGVTETDTYIFQPNGSQLAWMYSDNYGRDIQIAALPVTRTYTIMPAPSRPLQRDEADHAVANS